MVVSKELGVLFMRVLMLRALLVGSIPRHLVFENSQIAQSRSYYDDTWI